MFFKIAAQLQSRKQAKSVWIEHNVTLRFPWRRPLSLPFLLNRSWTPPENDGVPVYLGLAAPGCGARRPGASDGWSDERAQPASDLPERLCRGLGAAFGAGGCYAAVDGRPAASCAAGGRRPPRRRVGRRRRFGRGDRGRGAGGCARGARHAHRGDGRPPLNRRPARTDSKGSP